MNKNQKNANFFTLNLKSGIRNLKSALLLTVFFLSFMTTHTVVWADEGDALQDEPVLIKANPEDVAAGKKIYEKRCWGCHGVEGAGDGPAANRLYPRPRDFTSGIYKFHTTPIFELPRDDDLFETVSNGLPGTAMPAWKDTLTEKKRRQVITYIKTFDPRFEEESAPAQIDFGDQVPISEESIARGKEIFNRPGFCVDCHGKEGKGDAIKKLRDDFGNPIFPRNLTKTWRFRRGHKVKEIFTRVTVGIDGTPMESFAEKLSIKERWDVANFCFSLGGESKTPKGGVVKVTKINGELPSNPEDPEWNQARPVVFPLVGQIIAKERWFTPSVNSIIVRALYNEAEIAFLLEWDDRTNSRKGVDQEGDEIFNDMAAIQFPAGTWMGQEMPYFGMGDKTRAVDVWQWVSDDSVREVNANGIKKINIRPPDDAKIEGQGKYKTGTYRVVFRRPLVTDKSEKDIHFEIGKFLPIAFAAWDGSRGERGSRHSLSTWYWLILEPPTPVKVYVYPPLAFVITGGLMFWLSRREMNSRQKSDDSKQ